MTRLLVSVRDREEARVAVQAGVDLIDVKEPSRGALGAADGQVLAEVIATVGGRVPVSAALGELAQWPPAGWPAWPAGLQYAKLGLAGCTPWSAWSDRWADAIRSFPVATSPVAVLYADWATAVGPPPDAVLATATQSGCRVVLVDTFDKSHGNLLDYWSTEELARVVRLVRGQAMMLVLAGSLSVPTIPRILPFQPDFIAVRGAACRGGRDGQLDAGCVRALVQLLEQTPKCGAADEFP